MRKILMMAVALLAAACSPGSDVPLVKGEVDKFHKLMDAEKYADIYAASAEEFKKSATEEQLTQLVGGVHNGLGTFKSAPEPGWTDSVNNGSQFVTLDYESVYERGTATEKFIYKIADGKATLISYDVKGKPNAAAPADAPADAPAGGGNEDGSGDQ